MILYLNQNSFLQIPRADIANNFETVVFNIPEGRVIKVNKEGYFILRYIYEKGSIPDRILEELAYEMQVGTAKIKEFVEIMLKENILNRGD